jgi:hypothetical protein
MFLNDVPYRFELNAQLIFHQQITVEFAQDSTIFVESSQGMLLFNVQALLAEAVAQGVLVDLLEMAMAMIAVGGEASFADNIAETIDIWVHDGALFVVFRVFCGPSENEFI